MYWKLTVPYIIGNMIFGLFVNDPSTGMIPSFGNLIFMNALMGKCDLFCSYVRRGSAKTLAKRGMLQEKFRARLFKTIFWSSSTAGQQVFNTTNLSSGFVGEGIDFTANTGTSSNGKSNSNKVVPSDVSEISGISGFSEVSGISGFSEVENE